MTPRELLLAAADLLSMVGWTPYGFDRDKPMDVLKALKVAAIGVNGSEDVVAGAMNRIRVHVGDSVGNWQATRGLTGHEVIAELRLIALRKGAES